MNKYEKISALINGVEKDGRVSVKSIADLTGHARPTAKAILHTLYYSGLIIAKQKTGQETFYKKSDLTVKQIQDSLE